MIADLDQCKPRFSKLSQWLAGRSGSKTAAGTGVLSHQARCPTGKSISVVQPRLQKYCASSETQINFRTPAIPSHTEGAFRDRHGRWARDAMDAAASGSQQRVRRMMPMRTAKSCGPDAPTLVSSFCGGFRWTTVAKEPGHRGEREVSR